jgi:hypothetical protein
VDRGGGRAIRGLAIVYKAEVTLQRLHMMLHLPPLFVSSPPPSWPDRRATASGNRSFSTSSNGDVAIFEAENSKAARGLKLLNGRSIPDSKNPN